MKKKLVTLIAALIIVVVGEIIMYPKILGWKFRNQEVLSCRVSTGGGMLGGYHSVYLKKTDDGAVLEVTGKETHADREVKTVYQLNGEQLDQIRELVYRYDLIAASRRPYSRMQALDGDTTTISFDYEEDYFSISSEQSLNKKMREGFRKIQSYLNSLALSAGEGVTTIEPQSARVVINGYTEFFSVEEAMDGRLDEILGTDCAVSKAENWGIIFTETDLDVSGADTVTAAQPATIVYDPATRQIIIIYAEHDFGHAVYQLAHIEDYYYSTLEVLSQMEGTCRFYLN